MRISDWMSGVRSSDLKGTDLVAVCLDVVGRYDDGACRAFQLLRDVGHGGFLVFGIQHAMAFAIPAVAAPLGEAGYVPRQDERGVGKECGSPCRLGWGP